MSENNKFFSLTELFSPVTLELLHVKLNSLPKYSDLHKEFLTYLSRDFATSAINGISEYLVIVQNLLKEVNTQTEHNGRLAQHIWTIDVEGAEISVLKGIDFNKSDISVFSIENPTSPGNNQSLVRDFLENEGYKLVRSIGEDDIFAKATLLG